MSQHDPAGGAVAFDSPRNAKAQAKAEKAYRKASRPWFKKKRFWLLGIIVLIIAIAVATSGGSEQAADASAEAAGSATTEQAAAGATDGGAAEEAAPAFPGAKDSDVVGQAGDELTLGDVAVTAAPIAEGDATLGATLCTAVSVVNGTEETIDFNAFDWKLQAPSGTIVNAGFIGSDDLISAGQIAPGGTVSGDVCFEAKDSESGQYVVLYEPIFSFFSDRGAWINNF